MPIITKETNIEEYYLAVNDYHQELLVFIDTFNIVRRYLLYKKTLPLQKCLLQPTK